MAEAIIIALGQAPNQFSESLRVAWRTPGFCLFARIDKQTRGNNHD